MEHDVLYATNFNYFYLYEFIEQDGSKKCLEKLKEIVCG